MDSKKMREYKYIRNTLPDNVSRESNIEGLGIGKKVENLLPELNEENIGNGKGWQVDNPHLGSLKTSVKLDPNTTYSLQVINSSVTLTFIYTFKEKASFSSEYKEQYIFTSNDTIFYGLYYYRKDNSEAYVEEIRFLKEPDKDNWITAYTRKVNKKQGTEEFNWTNEKYRIIQSTSASAPSDFTKNLIEQEERKYPLFPIKFFNTGSVERFYYSIPGLTPYFNLENARYWKSDIQPAVYLFKTDSAWLVDKNGIIFGQSSEPFVYLGDISNTTLPIEYTDEYIKEVFKTITYENNEKQDELKFTVSEEMKKVVESGEEIYLATYRDRLTSDAQVTWNKQKFLARYGRIGQISNGSNSQRFYVKNDKFKADVLKNNYFSVNIRDKKLKRHEDIVISFFPENSTTDEFNLALGSVLGYNKKYTQSRGQDIAQRFTSICFAWVRKKDGVYERISDYSRPVIIDRQLSNGWSIENNEWVFNSQTVKVCEYSGLDNDLKGYGYSDGLYIILKQNINQ